MGETLARTAAAARKPSRRQFLVGSIAAGAGLTCGFALLPVLEGNAGEALAAGNFSPTVWYTIDRGGIVTVHITKSEMGQHVGTALAQAVAEELEADWRDIRIDYPDPAERWGLMVTGGSWSVNNTFDSLSRCGAAGRQALIEAAAAIMGVPAAQLHAANSRVIASSGKSMSYAQLVSTGKLDKTYSPDDLKANSAQKGERVQDRRQAGAGARPPGEDQRHGEIRHGHVRARHGLRQDRPSAGALRRQADRRR